MCGGGGGVGVCVRGGGGCIKRLVYTTNIQQYGLRGTMMLQTLKFTISQIVSEIFLTYIFRGTEFNLICSYNFNNVVNQLKLLWKLLQLICNYMYPCWHGSSPRSG